jgi:hypothetical protein
MGRRIFNRMVIEISLAVGHCVSRRALWVLMRERQVDPDQMAGEDVVAFCGLPLRRFLASQGLHLRPLELQRLERQLRGINPYRPDPYDRVDGLERSA